MLWANAATAKAWVVSNHVAGTSFHTTRFKSPEGGKRAIATAKAAMRTRRKRVTGGRSHANAIMVTAETRMTTRDS